MEQPTATSEPSSPALQAGGEGGGLVERIAARCGVSIATVSRALNNLPTVAEATRVRVLAAARAEGWTPRSRAAAPLRARPPAAEFALLLDHDDVDLSRAPTHARLHWALAHLAAERGGRIRLHRLAGPVAPAVRALRRSGVAGALVVYGIGDGDLAELAGLLPTVLVNGTPGRAVTSVCPDDEGSVALALDHLQSLGHRRIAFFDIHDHLTHGGLPNLHHMARTDAFRRLTAERGLGEARCEILPGRSIDLDEVCRCVLANWLHEPAPPTAILCAADVYAFAFHHAALTLGLRLPQQLSLVGIDDTDGCLAVRPRLTSVRQGFEDMARIAFHALLSRLDAPDLPPATVVTPARLVVRESTAAISGVQP